MGEDGNYTDHPTKDREAHDQFFDVRSRIRQEVEGCNDESQESSD